MPPEDSLVIPLTAVQRQQWFAGARKASMKPEEQDAEMKRSASDGTIASYRTAESLSRPVKKLSFAENRANRTPSATRQPNKLSRSSPASLSPITSGSSSAPSSPFRSPFNFFRKSPSAKSFTEADAQKASDPLPRVLVSSASQASLAATRTKRLSTGDHHILPSPLQAELASFSWEGYAHSHFQARKQGFAFRRKVPIATLAAWQSAPLLSPLLPLPRSLRSEAVKAFQLIQDVMERSGAQQSNEALDVLKHNWGLATLDRARDLLDIGVRHWEVRDEIYLQLLKQLTRNPSLYAGLCLALVAAYGKLDQALSGAGSSCKSYCLLSRPPKAWRTTCGRLSRRRSRTTVPRSHAWPGIVPRC
jgi:hypothetical protein